MDILGHDGTRGGYLIAVDTAGRRLSGLVPDRLLSEEHGSSAAVDPDAAHDWIATNRHDIETALAARAEGRPALAPFNRIVLVEE